MNKKSKVRHWTILTNTAAIALVALMMLPGMARAEQITNDFSIFIVDTDARGVPPGPWTGLTLTGSVAFDTDSVPIQDDDFATVYSATAMELTLPSGTVLGLSDFGSVQVWFPVEPYFGFTIFIDPEASDPDPLDISIRSIQFTVNNTDGAGFRYFDDANFGGGTFANGYYGEVSYGDIDECALGFDDCVAGATCTNTPGGFTCECPPGYSGDGVEACTEDDECSMGIDNCDANATCTNTVGSFTCECNSGFTGDGVECIATNQGSSGCSVHGNASPNWLLAIILGLWVLRKKRSGA